MKIGIGNVLLAMACAAVLTACADQPPARQTAKSLPAADSYCLHETGSRLRPRDNGCQPSTGRTITREEIERTGSINVGEAVNRIIPR